jgi:hypothetical protein
MTEEQIASVRAELADARQLLEDWRLKRNNLPTEERVRLWEKVAELEQVLALGLSDA